jgi:hypothetical protein
VLTGRTIADKIRVGEIIGAGGMGVVYAGEHLGLQTKVAIKVLHHGGDAQARSRFQTEARALANLRHPRIVAVLDFGVTDDGIAYMVSELLAGRSADRILDEHGHLPWRWVLQLVRQMLLALEAAHELGIVHRDVKPANCLCVDFASLHEPPRAKLLDFGVAKLQGRDLAAPKATQAGEIIGTAAYMPPEQASGGPIDGRSDLYSVGATAYELLTGVPLFRGATAVDLLWQHVHATPEAPEAVNPQARIPAAVSRLILGAVAKDPDRRPASARDFREALDAVVVEADAEASDSGAFVSPPGPPRRVPNRGRRVWPAGVAGLVACSGVVWWVARAPVYVGVDGATPRSCADLLAARADLPSGVYAIDPDGPGNAPAFDAYCDMKGDGGGWTLVAQIHRAHTQGLAGAQNFLSLPMNEHLLLGQDPAVGTEPLVSSHGRARLEPLVAAATVSRMVLRAQDDPMQHAAWFKQIDAPDAFFRWFSAAAHPATAVCLDPQLHEGCRDGRILSESRDLSGAQGRVTVLEGMNLADHGYRTEGDVHVRLSGDDFNHLAGVCSYTFFEEAWRDSLDGHWGNGLEIWVR